MKTKTKTGQAYLVKMDYPSVDGKFYFIILPTKVTDVKFAIRKALYGDGNWQRGCDFTATPISHDQSDDGLCSEALYLTYNTTTQVGVCAKR